MRFSLILRWMWRGGCAGSRRNRLVGHSCVGKSWLWDDMGDVDADGRAQVALALIDTTAGIGPDWLPRLEEAQRQWPADAAIQGAVGAALAERRLWGKARRPLEQAATDPTLEPRARRKVWRVLAALAREEGDELRAGECDRAAAAID